MRTIKVKTESVQGSCLVEADGEYIHVESKPGAPFLINGKEYLFKFKTWKQKDGRIGYPYYGIRVTKSDTGWVTRRFQLMLQAAFDKPLESLFSDHAFMKQGLASSLKRAIESTQSALAYSKEQVKRQEADLKRFKKELANL